MRVLLSTLNAKYIHSSLALRNFRSYCQPELNEIIVKEYTINNTLLDMLADVYSNRPEIVGFACYIWNIKMTLELAHLIKKVLPDVKVVLGGPEVSYESLDILRKYDYIDYIVLGEGEETVKKLLMALNNQDVAQDIAGLTWRQARGELKEGCPQIVENLDSIPFAYEHNDIVDLSDKIIYYESSRGCPFSCQYCLSSATAGVRYYSMNRIFRDLQFFVDHNVKQVKFVDRTFNASKQHYFPILKFLADQECRTNFHFEIAADILDEEVLDFLKHVPKGRFQFEVGIQSTNQSTLEEIRRNNNWPQIVNVVSKILSYGNIHIHLDLIVGLPFENMDRFGQSFNDVLTLKPDMLQIGFLKLLKGAGVRARAHQHGYVQMDIPPYEVLANRYISYQEIRELKLLEDLFNHLYNSGHFKFSLPYLISISGGDAFLFFRSLTAYWEERGLTMTSLSTKTLFKVLMEYCVNTFNNIQVDICLNVFKLDALMSENGKVRPEFLPWNSEKWSDDTTAFWRNPEIVKKYITDYCFTTWRDLKKNYHIEIFDTPLPSYLKLQENQNDITVILFSYTTSEPRYQRILNEDFWPKGGCTDAI